MRLSEIEKKARSLGIKDTWKYSKKELIRAIQRKEGNFDCFGTAVNYCDQFCCLWRQDCLKPAQK
ncbi:MAG: SAP domain-containing protein [Candidatus Omnitrophica bacterium]|nr:SAP domain-containing protein [Candidatus Omnitrophota bacterium]